MRRVAGVLLSVSLLTALPAKADSFWQMVVLMDNEAPQLGGQFSTFDQCEARRREIVAKATYKADHPAYVKPFSPEQPINELRAEEEKARTNLIDSRVAVDFAMHSFCTRRD